MSVPDYFKALDLQVVAELLLSLPDEQAADMVVQAYDRLINAGNARGAANPRFAVYKEAKDALCDPLVRQHNARQYGYTGQGRKTEEPRPSETEEPLPSWKRGRPPLPRTAGAAPWWVGGLVAVPAAILYISAGLTFARTPEPSPLDPAALVVAVLTFWFLGLRGLQLVIGGPFFMGVGWLLAGLTVAGFATDMGSWSVAPEIGVVAVFAALGVAFALAGWVPPVADFTKEYVAGLTLCFFVIALLLIPAVSVVVPTRGSPPAGTLAGGNDEGSPSAETVPTALPKNARKPTAQVEGELNLTRNDWRSIQAGLQVLGHYTGSVDGLAGPRTRASITAWQRTQSGVATSFLNRAQADSLAAVAPPTPTRRDAPRGSPAATSEPEPASTATLVVRAEPDSRIALDDEEAGFTSESGVLRIPEVTPGGHLLRAEKDGFDTVTRTLEVAPGVSVLVELVARALPGRLTVTTNVADAIVAIDGGAPTAAPVEGIEVESGARLVTVSAPGYDTDEQYVDVAAGGTTTHHAALDETSLDAEIAQLRRLFDSRSYADAEAFAAVLARTLGAWGNLGIDVREDLALTLAIQGQALYALGNFAGSVQPLYNAVRLGQQIALPIKHRHGGGGFRQGFCSGSLVYGLDRIAFRSVDDPDHGFAVEPQAIERIEAAEAQGGHMSRLNTEVDGRGSMDFVHPNSEQRRRDPDSPLYTDIVCRDCNQALAVHEQLLRLLTRRAQ